MGEEKQGESSQPKQVEKGPSCAACNDKEVPQGESPQARAAQKLGICWGCYRKPSVANRRRKELGLPLKKASKKKKGRKRRVPRNLKTVFAVIFEHLDALASAMNEVSDVVDTVSEKAEGIMATIGNVSGELEGRAKETREKLSAAEDRLRDSAVKLSESVPQEKRDWRLKR